jgi:hypothetical protein
LLFLLQEEVMGGVFADPDDALPLVVVTSFDLALRDEELLTQPHWAYVIVSASFDSNTDHIDSAIRIICHALSFSILCSALLSYSLMRCGTRSC